MSRHHFYRPLTDSEGNLSVGSTVTAKDSKTGVTIPGSELFVSDDVDSETLDNPFTVTDGIIDFYMDYPRIVDLLVTKPGVGTQSIPNMSVGALMIRADLDFALSGQVIALGEDGETWEPYTIPDPEPDIGFLNDLTDVQVGTPEDGGLLHYNISDDGFSASGPTLIGNLVLAPGANVPPGTVPCIVWDMPLTLTKNHPLEGANGAAVSAASEGFNSFNGAALTYTNAHKAVGSTSVRVAAGSIGYFTDSGLAMTGAYTRMYLRFDGTPTGNTNFFSMRTAAAGLASLQRDGVTGQVRMKNGAGTTLATTSTVLNPDTWYRVEWRVGGATQTLRIFDLAGELLSEASCPCTAGEVDSIRYGIDLNLNGSLYMDAAAVAVSWIGEV